jgi:hypothetical protein
MGGGGGDAGDDGGGSLNEFGSTGSLSSMNPDMGGGGGGGGEGEGAVQGGLTAVDEAALLQVTEEKGGGREGGGERRGGDKLNMWVHTVCVSSAWSFMCLLT